MAVDVAERTGLREQLALDKEQLWRQWLSPSPDQSVIDKLLAHIAYCESQLEGGR
jgi:cell division FtsZ-interacting protein ZapD